MSTGYLHKYFLNNPSKMIHKWTHYFDIYERHFERFRFKSPVILEIGVMAGGSLAMWKSYFGDGAQIIGLDINPKCKSHETNGVEIFIGSQDDTEILQSIISKYPHIDIVLDDGSHFSPHMIATFNYLYDHVQPYGVYLVEDTHANYWPEWGGGLKRAGTFMEFTKDKLDEINAAHMRDMMPVSRFAMSTDCISVYDSVVVFERRPQVRRQDLTTWAMSLPPEDLKQV